LQGILREPWRLGPIFVQELPIQSFGSIGKERLNPADTVEKLGTWAEVTLRVKH
jgi:hypothetical protein